MRTIETFIIFPNAESFPTLIVRRAGLVLFSASAGERLVDQNLYPAERELPYQVRQ
jgi:hypothetical protein